MPATNVDPCVLIMEDPRPCEECGDPTDQLDVCFEAVLCTPCNERLTAQWVFDTYTHCGRCGQEFTEGSLQLGTRRGVKRWRYCIPCNFKGPTVVEPFDERLPKPAETSLPQATRTVSGAFRKGHAL